MLSICSMTVVYQRPADTSMLSGLKILFKHAALAPSGAHHQVSFYIQSHIICLKLLGVPQSMCSLRVIIVAKALNIPLEVQLIDVSKGAHKSPEYISKYQPFGPIPVLLDGDFSPFESRAICRYLIKQIPNERHHSIDPY